MVKILIILHFLFFCAFSYAAAGKESTLVFKHFNKNDIESPITLIQIVGRKSITIHAKNGKNCELSIDKMSADVPPIENCDGEYVDGTEKYIDEWVDVFSTLEDGGVVSCQYSNDGKKVVGVSVTGNVTVDGVGMFVHRGIALDIDVYRREAPKPEKENEMIRQLKKYALKALFNNF